MYTQDSTGREQNTIKGDYCEKRTPFFKILKSLIRDKRDKSITVVGAWLWPETPQLTTATFSIALVKYIFIKTILAQTFLRTCLCVQGVLKFGLTPDPPF